MTYYEELETLLESMVHHRVSLKDLKITLERAFRVEDLDIVDYCVNGEDGIDDRFSFSLENEFGDMYIEIYYLTTNTGAKYITEISLDHDDWKMVKDD